MFGFFKKNKKPEEPHVQIKPAKQILDLRPGEKISLHKDEEWPSVLQGAVKESFDESFTVDIITPAGTVLAPFKENIPLVITIRRQDKTATFKSNFLRMGSFEERPVMVLDYPEQVEWEQTRHRRHNRIEADIPAKLGPPDQDKDLWEMIRIINFSMSGLSCLCNGEYKKGDKINIKLVSMQFPLNLSGMVVRTVKIDKTEGSQPMNRLIGVEFYEDDTYNPEMMSNFIHYIDKMNSGKNI